MTSSIALVFGVHGPKSRWLAAWLGGAAIGIGNGVVREETYGRQLPEADANRVSALTAVLAFAAYFRFLQRRWPLRHPGEAVAVGASWLLATLAFEVGFGRAVAKRSWRELAADYDVRRGRLWPLVLVSIAVGPELARRTAR